ncbi:DUF4166 domain-containing protein, partial [Methylopila musalis]
RSAGGALPLAAIEAEMAPYAIATAIDRGPHGPAVMERMLGKAAFAALPAPLKAFHGADARPVWRGRVRVEAGTSLVARGLRRLIGLPEAGEDRPITVSVDRLAEGAAPAEVWTRNVDGRRFASRLAADAAGGIEERFGCVTIRLAPVVRDGRIEMTAAGARVCGVALPRALWPRCAAAAWADERGRYRFDVRLALPVFGPLIRYAGWLAPKGADA